MAFRIKVLTAADLALIRATTLGSFEHFQKAKLE